MTAVTAHIIFETIAWVVWNRGSGKGIANVEATQEKEVQITKKRRKEFYWALSQAHSASSSEKVAAKRRLEEAQVSRVVITAAWRQEETGESERGEEQSEGAQ